MTDAEEQLVCIVLRQRVIIAFSKYKSESGSTGDEEKELQVAVKLPSCCSLGSCCSYSEASAGMKLVLHLHSQCMSFGCK